MTVLTIGFKDLNVRADNKPFKDIKLSDLCHESFLEAQKAEKVILTDGKGNSRILKAKQVS